MTNTTYTDLTGHPEPPLVIGRTFIQPLGDEFVIWADLTGSGGWQRYGAAGDWRDAARLARKFHYRLARGVPESSPWRCRS